MEKVCGVICEYNPLHRGHAHHLERARALTGADFVVCAMSGPFVQRGEPAVLDKWTRAQAALLAGADLVLELPALFAVRAAPDFAFGGAALLAGLGVVTHLSFGAEDADLAHLTGLAAPESAEESARIRAYLEGGHSHPQARALARGRQLPPNVTLGVEYLRALRRLGSGMEPVPVPRETAHNDERLHALSSATAVRRRWRPGTRPARARRSPPRPRTCSCAPCRSPCPPSRPSPPSSSTSCARRRPRRCASALPSRRGWRTASAGRRSPRRTQTRSLRRYSAGAIRRRGCAGCSCRSCSAWTPRPCARIRRRSTRACSASASAPSRCCAPSPGREPPLVTKVADAPAGGLLSLDLAAQDVWDLAAGHPGRRDFTERLRILAD